MSKKKLKVGGHVPKRVLAILTRRKKALRNEAIKDLKSLGKEKWSNKKLADLFDLSVTSIWGMANCEERRGNAVQSYEQRKKDPEFKAKRAKYNADYYRKHQKGDREYLDRKKTQMKEARAKKAQEKKSNVEGPRVKNKQFEIIDHKTDIYVGRPTVWGNPFVIGKDGTREEVIAKYELYVRGNPFLIKNVKTLKGKNLVCHCAPQACHADILLKLAND